jgi:NAD(P)-dependent dehydrogenase (short-subunit alcohol dehydrogenase family)
VFPPRSACCWVSPTAHRRAVRDFLFPALSRPLLAARLRLWMRFQLLGLFPIVFRRVRLFGTRGRFGSPTDPARLIGRLATDEGRWIVGQVLMTDGGFGL